MTLRRWSLAGIAMPRALAPSVDAREWEEGNRFRLHVAVSLPLIGPVVGYEGWLSDMVGADGLEPPTSSV